MTSNNNEKLDIASGSVKLDIFQHLKLGIQNREKNCKCDTPITDKYYCIPCKISCCKSCTLSEHKSHLLIPKANYVMELDKIDKSFTDYDSLFEKDDLFKNIENKKNELINEVNNTYITILKMINEWKNKKLDEINSLFDEFDSNLKNINDLKKECLNKLYNFSKKHKNFLGLNDSEKNKNKDPNNSIFLINYDLLNISYIWSSSFLRHALNIKTSMEEYQQREKAQYNNIVKDIYEILFNKDDEDPETHEKINMKFLPIINLKLEIKELNGDRLKEVDKRITKFNKSIESFKTNVLNSIINTGSYKDIEKENTIFEHRKIKGVDNLFSQRKIDNDKSEENNSIFPDKPIKSKNDITLDNPIIIKYFTHILTDIYDQYFRIPTIELQSSHADLKLKSADNAEDESDYAKVIEGTDKIMLFDKKTCKLTKKKINLQKNPHGYTKFPLGCRWVLVGEKLYITGGKDEYMEYPNCLIYDRKTEKIKRIMDMKNPRSYHTMVFNEIFETLMVIGGEENATVEIFDPLSNRWQVLPELNIPRAIPLFHFDEGRGNMYVLFGVEGNYLNSNYTDTIEILDLTEIKMGWMKINYNNKARMDFKCHLNIYPLNDYSLLIYGALESRANKRKACLYHLVKAEMNLIDKKILEELRSESKHNKLLNSIMASVSKSSLSQKSDGNQ